MLRLGPNHAIFGGIEKKFSLLRKKCAKMRWEVLGPNFLGMSRKMLAWKALKSAWLDFAYFLRSDPSKRGHLRPGKCCFRGVLLNIHGTLHMHEWQVSMLPKKTTWIQVSSTNYSCVTPRKILLDSGKFSKFELRSFRKRKKVKTVNKWLLVKYLNT